MSGGFLEHVEKVFGRAVSQCGRHLFNRSRSVVEHLFGPLYLQFQLILVEHASLARIEEIARGLCTNPSVITNYRAK